MRQERASTRAHTWVGSAGLVISDRLWYAVARTCVGALRFTMTCGARAHGKATLKSSAGAVQALRSFCCPGAQGPPASGQTARLLLQASVLCAWPCASVASALSLLAPHQQGPVAAVGRLVDQEHVLAQRALHHLAVRARGVGARHQLACEVWVKRRARRGDPVESQQACSHAMAATTAANAEAALPHAPVARSSTTSEPGSTSEQKSPLNGPRCDSCTAKTQIATVHQHWPWVPAKPTAVQVCREQCAVTRARTRVRTLKVSA